MHFLNDNAPIYIARLIKNWLVENSVLTLALPPYSPDLNYIKNGWPQLKEKVNEIKPDLLNPYYTKAYKLDRLKEVLPEAWNSIKELMFKALWTSMLKWVEAVIMAKGWYTKY